MADIKISELERVQSLNNGDLVEVSQEDSYSETGYSSKSAKMTDLGEKVVNGIEYTSELNTSNKKIIGAINEIASYTPIYGNTASGAIATFDTSLALPLQDCTIAINAVQEGSSTPSPDNVRPISGFTGANIHVADDETPHVIDNVTAITWQSEAGTVYGGSLDVTSGKLTVDCSDLLDLGNLSWGYNANYGGIFFAQTTASHTRGQAIICDCYKTTNISIDAPNTDWNSVQDLTIGLHYQGGVNYIYVKNSNYTDAVAFTSAMSGHKYITAIATPVTYQLTPTQISAIVETNNVFTDTNGNTSVVYACSLKDYIDSQ